MQKYRVENSDGEGWEVSEDKLHKAEADGFLPVVSNGVDKHRVKFDKIPVAKADGYKLWNDLAADGEGQATLAADKKDRLKPITDVSDFAKSARAKLEEFSPLSGITNRIGSAGKALYDEAVDTFGTDSGKSFGQHYTEDLDQHYRQRDEDAVKSKAGAVTGTALGITGSLAAGGPQGILANTALGAVEGATRDKDLSVKGAIEGGVIGGGLTAAGKVIGKAVPYAKALVNEDARNAVIDAAKEGMKADTLVNQIPTAGVGKWWSGLNAADQKVMQIVSASQEGKQLAASVRQHIGPGSAKDLSDPEVLAIMLQDEGANPVKDFFAKKASVLGVDAADYGKQLARNADDSYAARTFNKRDAAEDMAPILDDLKSTFESTRKSRMQELTEQARNDFDGDLTPTLRNLEKAYASAGELNSTKGAAPIIDDTYNILRNGKNADDLGLSEGHWGDHDGPELFNRLQKARENLDDNIDWDAIRRGNRSATPVEKKLMKVRQQIDESLKGASDSKVEADSLFKQSKKLEKTFFKLTTDKDGVHEVSLAKLLGDNDKSVKFKSWLQDMEDYAARTDLSPELKENADYFLTSIKKAMGTADDQRALNTFKMKTGGPTSGAVDRLGTIAQGNDFLKQAVQQPSQYLMSREQLSQRAKEIFGISWDKLQSKDKQALMKYQLWASKNLDANPEAATAMWRKFQGGGK